MNLDGIINIAGWKGLYKVISRNKNHIIVESLTNKKRTPLYSHNQANMLEEIGIYTYDDTIPLIEIFNKIANKENCGQCINHKSPTNDLIAYFREILEDYDEERVYISDIKKVTQWYNLLQSIGLIEIKKDTK